MVPRFPVLAVETSADEADDLGPLLFELGATGIEQRDGETHPAGPCRLAWPTSGDEAAGGLARSDPAASPARLVVAYGEVETADGQLRSFESRTAVGSDAAPRAGSEVLLLAYFADSDRASQALDELRRTAPVARARLVELWGDEWRDRYRKAFAPFDLTSTLTVVPPWLEPPRAAAGAGRQVLIIDPGRAFGTGLHATTALVARLLEEHRETLAGQELLDVGTGSGILAVAAVRLGARRVVAIDNDPVAVDAARVNVERNGLVDRISVGGEPVGAVSGCFPWVVANIEQPVLCALAGELTERAAAGARLVLSGLLEPGLEELYEALGVGRHGAQRRFELVATRRRTVDRDRWVAVLLRRLPES